MLTQHMHAMALCLSVCLSMCLHVSVTNRCSTKMSNWIKLIFGMEASLEDLYTLSYKEIRVTPK